MAVRRVDTLGCHPLVLMQKLAAIGGLEILKEEKHTHDGVEYPYHIAAKVKDGLYVEAKDPLYEQAVTPERLPSLFGRRDGTRAAELEVTEEMLSRKCQKMGDKVYTETLAINVSKNEVLPETPLGLSVMFSAFSGENLNNGAQIYTGHNYSGVSFGYEPTAADVSKVMQVGPPLTLVDSGSSLGLPSGSHGRIALVAPVEGAISSGSGIVLSAFHEKVAYRPPKDETMCYLGSPRTGASNPKRDMYVGVPLVGSGTIVRMSSTLSGGDLLFPTPWRILPIMASAISNDGGLYFCYPSGETSNVLGFVTIRPVSEGSPSAAIYDTECFFASQVPFMGERLFVKGSPSNPTGTITMLPFSPEVPIPVDSVSGGPVVTDLFAYNSEEIRGSVEGLLAARDNLPVGSVGWLDGKRYRVHLPGRMLQIG